MYQCGKRNGSPDAQMHTDYITGSGFLVVTGHGLWRNSERKDREEIPRSRDTVSLSIGHLHRILYAMTWDELREMKETGLFDFQSHTYWHPDFRKEKKRLKSEEYEKFVEMQLKKSKEKLEKELNVKVTMLAWPFGIYDDELIKKAVEAGYVAGFTMKRHHACLSDNIMALPRYLMINRDRANVYLERILVRSSAQG